MFILQGDHGSVTNQGVGLECQRLWGVIRLDISQGAYPESKPEIPVENPFTSKKIILGLDPRTMEWEIHKLAFDSNRDM